MPQIFFAFHSKLLKIHTIFTRKPRLYVISSWFCVWLDLVIGANHLDSFMVETPFVKRITFKLQWEYQQLEHMISSKNVTLNLNSYIFLRLHKGD